MRHSTWVRVLLATASIPVLAACGPAVDPSAITYYKDIAPLLERQCISCHSTGGIAPFALDSYASATQYVASMRQSVTSRSMPPQPLTNDGSCQEFTNARWLTDDEIRLIGYWMDQGTLEGDPSDTPAEPTPAPSITRSLELTTPLYSPSPSGNGGLNDDYRCFLIDPQLPKDQLVTGFEVLPGAPAIVHHALVFSVDPAKVVDSSSGTTNAQVMAALQANSGGKPGWDCYGLSGEGVVPSGLVASWAPGEGLTLYPDNTGLRIRQGDVTVVQIHYNLDYASGSDQTVVRLEVADGVLLEGVNLLADGFLDTLSLPEPAKLPAGNANALFEWQVSFEQIEAFIQEYSGYEGAVPGLSVFGIYPHMHTLGQKMSVTLSSSQGQTCAADVAAWDFNWQQFYFYKDPLSLKAGDAVKITCVYDTRSRTEDTLPGLGTDDEMCMLGAFVSISSSF